LKDVFKIVVYFVAVIALGAILAPLLFWGVHALEPWALANGFLRWDPTPDNQVAAHGWFSFLEADFQKYFNRAMLLSAVALLWPALRWIGLKRGELKLYPDPRPWTHFFFGLAVSAFVVAAMAAAYLALGYYHLKSPAPWSALPKIALSAVVVAIIEEALFRGAILGLFLKTMHQVNALFFTTLIFAALHFLKPDEDVVVTQVAWYSGFTLLPYVFHQFAEPGLLLAGFSTLFMLGWLLGYARIRTDSLWMSIGLHAGVVFVKMSFSKITKRDADFLPWVGPELQIGLVPVFLLLLALLIVWRRVEYEELLPSRPARK
jgi:membrane protease YdiL (CAAX protease family)